MSKDRVELDWQSIGFDYIETACNVRCYYRNGAWGELEVDKSAEISIPLGASCLHYGQEAFEGLKAFEGVDGRVRVFRADDHYERLCESAEAILMPIIPKELFDDAIALLLEKNRAYIPPYQSGATLYLRPMLIGMTPNVVVKPAQDFTFVVYATPVGPYFRSGIRPCRMLMMRDYDRVAPRGTGHCKVGGNYASGFMAEHIAKSEGYASAIFLDPLTKTYIEECGAANFFAIKGNRYITPKSQSILPSITNKSLMTLARELGLEVEERPVPIGELVDFDEVGACGTGAVITPIAEIKDYDTGHTYKYGNGEEIGAISRKLYDLLQAIQYGRVADKYGWTLSIFN